MVKALKVKAKKEVRQKAAIIKKSMAGVRQNVSRGAERVAEIILDENKDQQGHKTQKITDETVAMFKGVSRQIRSDLKGVELGDFVAVGAYSAGKAAAAVKRGFKLLLG
ncbi:MAG: hypothetical protein HQL14_00710 [Candidatus Omnitrophica bacterium]|nr:hypothetical protein [Candidatus Omnitrophota bacterium]